MAKENICGKAFEELTNDEMVEYEGGAIFTTVTTASCIMSTASVVASVIASVVASIAVTVK